jgi:polyhydroxyalkanoate synthesis regulator phasin
MTALSPSFVSFNQEIEKDPLFIEIKQLADIVINTIENMNIDEAREHSKKLVKERKIKYIIFENYMKNKIIHILNDKILEQHQQKGDGESQKNIIDTLFEIFDGYISKRAIWEVLSDLRV